MNTNYLETAVSLARQAGEIGRTIFLTARESTWKSDNTPVTEADIAAQRVIREASGDATSRVARAIRIALGRTASAVELSEGAAFLAAQTATHSQQANNLQAARAALADFCHVLINSNEFAFVD